MIKKLSAEALGTFWLVFGGCGSAVLAAAFPDLGIGFAGVALAFGLTVLTMAYAVGHISGGHFNPAVSVGLAVSGRFSWGQVVPYAVAQGARRLMQGRRGGSPGERGRGRTRLEGGRQLRLRPPFPQALLAAEGKAREPERPGSRWSPGAPGPHGLRGDPALFRPDCLAWPGVLRAAKDGLSEARVCARACG